jgi:hypothetical protein
MAFEGTVVTVGCLAWRDWKCMSGQQCSATDKRVTDPKEPVEEGDVVRPLLEGRLKERQGSLDAGGVLAIGLVVSRGVFWR